MDVIVSLPSISLIVIGLAVCFLGYRFFRLSLALIGAGIGFSIAEYLFENYSHVVNLSGNDTAHLVFVLLFAIGFGTAAFALYIKAVMVLTSIGMGYWVYSAYHAYSGKSDIKTTLITWLIGIGIGLILGFAVKSVQRWAIILFTAAGGAQVAAKLSAPYLLANPTVEKMVLKIEEAVFPGLGGNSKVMLTGILLIMFFTAGVIVQSQGKK